MSISLLTGTVIIILISAYFLYSRFIARQFKLDDTRATPAKEINDGVDYVPTNRFYLLGQHFSAIAAAGPIVGPIAACMLFGWVPCILWIVIGVIFIGAVHDFSSLVASIKHKAQSIAEIVKQNLGKRAYTTMIAFIWIALLYVIVAFTDVTANTFIGKTEELEGKHPFNPGGAVAGAAIMYLLLAIVMGLVQKKAAPSLWITTAVFVPATLGVIWLGTQVSTTFIMDHKMWAISILAYCFVASLLPVWLLLQPRGYLGGFVLYMALAVGVIGIFFGNFSINQQEFKQLVGPGLTDDLFPFLFVTIACGACSGFHGLVCSGTTSKQIAKETDCRVIGYGGMLLEGFVAVIALCTALIATKAAAPGVIYGEGIGNFLVVIIGQANLSFAITFGAIAFSTFVFDTLDVATRLGRYMLQELFNVKGWISAVIATGLTVAIPLVFILASKPGSWLTYWTLFGASNQLLAALTLLAISVWLKKSGRPFWFTIIPMLFVMTITIWALIVQIINSFSKELSFSPTTINGFVSILFILLAASLGYDSMKALGSKKKVVDPED